MTIQQNTDRIQTTHIGSLPRPHDLLDLMKAKLSGQPYDQKKYDELLSKSVSDVVRKQVDCGIDIVTDGEFSSPVSLLTSRNGSEGSSRGPIKR